MGTGRGTGGGTRTGAGRTNEDGAQLLSGRLGPLRGVLCLSFLERVDLFVELGDETFEVLELGVVVRGCHCASNGRCRAVRVTRGGRGGGRGHRGGNVSRDVTLRLCSAQRTGLKRRWSD